MTKVESSLPAGGELAWIQQIRAAVKARSKTLRLGIGDDCAILRPPTGHEVVVTTDFSLEGVHFRRDWHSAREVGHRVLARGLSDVAAMGARPLAAFLSLALPHGLPSAWRQDFLDGLLTLADAHKVPLAGGDTSRAPGDAVLADVVLLGSAPAGTALRRDGARAGDSIYVTGTLGAAAAELADLSAVSGKRRGVDRRGSVHVSPQPRLAVGEALRRRKLATACIDLSDGLSTDLTHLAEASGLAAVVDTTTLPVHPMAAAREDTLELALHGGEDYELLFTAHPATKVPKTIAGVPVTRIGEMRRARPKGARLTLQTAGGSARPLERGGWEHSL